MFGFGQPKEDPAIVEAKKRIMRIEKRKAGSLGEGEKGDEPEMEPVGMTILFAYTCFLVLAGILMKGSMKSHGLDFHTGMDGFDQVMFSSGEPIIVGNAIANFITVAFIRGTVYFLVAGFWPLLSLAWVRAIDRPNLNPYLSIWGMTVGFPLVIYFCKGYFFPLLGQVWDLL